MSRSTAAEPAAVPLLADDAPGAGAGVGKYFSASASGSAADPSATHYHADPTDPTAVAPPEALPEVHALPQWWLAAIAVYGATTAVSSVFDIIIFPTKIGLLVGDGRKHAILGALMSMRGTRSPWAAPPLCLNSL